MGGQRHRISDATVRIYQNEQANAAHALAAMQHALVVLARRAHGAERDHYLALLARLYHLGAEFAVLPDLDYTPPMAPVDVLHYLSEG